MDNETPTTEATAKAKAAGRSLPKNAVFSALPAADATVEPSTAPQAMTAGETLPDPGERDGVFRQLVTEDGDIAGLVAYSIYKQNKLDWMTAFRETKGRAPVADELDSYIIGEGTPRRIRTYRHLAEAMLAGTGPDGGGSSPLPRSRMRRGGVPVTSLVALYAIVALVLVAGFVLATHYTVATH
jgi:hypothetical protein